MWQTHDPVGLAQNQSEEQDEQQERKRQFATRMHDKVYKPRLEQTDPEKYVPYMEDFEESKMARDNIKVFKDKLQMSVLKTPHVVNDTN